MRAPSASPSDGTSQSVRVARYDGRSHETVALQELAGECARALGYPDSSGAAELLARDAMQADRICLMSWDGPAAVGYAVLAPGTFGPLEECWWLDVVYVRPASTLDGAEWKGMALRGLLDQAREAAGPKTLYYVRRRGQHRAAHGVRPVGMVFRVEAEAAGCQPVPQREGRKC